MAVFALLSSLVLLCSFADGHYNAKYRRQDGLTALEREKGCSSNPADIVFVLDESGSIWGPHFELQLKFVNDVIDIFRIGPDLTRIGVMTYSDQSLVHFQMDEYDNDADIKSAVSGIGQRRGGTNTAGALETMRDDLLSDYQTREGVTYIGIVITDGESEDPPETARQAELAKSRVPKPITLFAVGVGHSIIETELYAIASSPEYVFMVENYDALDTLKEALAWKACQVTTLPPPTTTPLPTTTPTTTPPPQYIEGCDDDSPVDIVFTIPDQAGIIGTDSSIDLIKNVVDAAHISETQVRVGLAPRNCVDVEEIQLNDNDNKPDLLSDLERRRLTATPTQEHLDYLTDTAYLPSKGGREEAVKMAVMIIDNEAEDWPSTQDKVEELKSQGVYVVVIGVIPRAKREQLTAMATSANDVITVDSYEELPLVSDQVLRSMCNALRTARL